ncbi:MAG: hypothetical protein M3Z96_08600 [Pseudomonadota bacterium]|nr:hypothetical protein [Pseudomonadota bacterium]
MAALSPSRGAGGSNPAPLFHGRWNAPRVLPAFGTFAGGLNCAARRLNLYPAARTGALIS